MSSAEPGPSGNEHVANPNTTEPEIEHQADRPNIWVGSWLDYNNGILHGDWIPADRADAEIWADIHTMLARSPTAAESGETAEEWGILDTDNFGPLRIAEQESIAWIGAVARGIAEHGPAFAAWADVTHDKDLLDGFADAFIGEYDSVEAYAEQLVDDLGYQDIIDQAIPESLRVYLRFDTDALARDMQLGGDIHVLPTGANAVWIFDARQ